MGVFRMFVYSSFFLIRYLSPGCRGNLKQEKCPNTSFRRVHPSASIIQTNRPRDTTNQLHIPISRHQTHYTQPIDIDGAISRQDFHPVEEILALFYSWPFAQHHHLKGERLTRDNWNEVDALVSIFCTTWGGTSSIDLAEKLSLLA